MTATLDTPAAPVSADQSAAIQPTIQGALIEFLATQDDAAHIVADLVLAVAAARPTAAEQLHVLRTVKNACERIEKRDDGPRQALLDAVIAAYGEIREGQYTGFKVVPVAGRKGVDYARLLDRYPSVYADVVTTAPDTFSVSCTPA